MKFDYNNMQNMDINNMMKYIVFISFVAQWSIISMILNLFTMGILRLPLFVLLIADALTMIKLKNKTIKRPSFLLSKMWDVIEFFQHRKSNESYHGGNSSSSSSIVSTISNHFTSIKDKIRNIFNNFNSSNNQDKKYNTERELNKFNAEIGKKITIEYTSEDNKLKKKDFKYKDRATTYLKMLEAKGYKNYTKYNLNPQQSLTYIIFNKNKDIIDIENNRIQTKKEDKDYKFITDGWPKK